MILQYLWSILDIDYLSRSDLIYDPNLILIQNFLDKRLYVQIQAQVALWYGK